jgi:transcriptional regulator NrdR family protein
MPNDKGFSCPACSFRMDVIDSRPSKIEGQPAMRRRRRCKNCETRITTYEIAGAQDIEDLRFSLGRIMMMAKNAHSALTILIDQYGHMITREDRK